MRGLFGKRVLVTGSSRGIGLSTARRFLQEGADVIVHGRTQQSVDIGIAELESVHRNALTGIAADLSIRAECRRLAAAVGRIDVLVNSAGVLESFPVEGVDDARWHRVIDVNVTAPWVLTRSLLPVLRNSKGVVVNVSSDAGLLGYASNTVYCASKGALIGLTRALAVELAPDVRVLCVCPGSVDTDMMQRSVAASPDPEAAHRSWTSGPLLQRAASPDEIAAAIAFAASDDCSYATGNLIVVDGGTTAGRRVPEN